MTKYIAILAVILFGCGSDDNTEPADKFVGSYNCLDANDQFYVEFTITKIKTNDYTLSDIDFTSLGSNKTVEASEDYITSESQPTTLGNIEINSEDGHYIHFNSCSRLESGNIRAAEVIYFDGTSEKTYENVDLFKI